MQKPTYMQQRQQQGQRVEDLAPMQSGDRDQHSSPVERSPGPWSVGGEWPSQFGVYDSNARYIALAVVGQSEQGEPPDYKFWPAYPNRAEARRNARLIAAAPDLLEALRGLMTPNNSARGTYAWQVALTAIARATESGCSVKTV